MSTFFYFTGIAFLILVAVVLCFVILIQESKSSGLGASFGGDAGESVFGTSTADVLKKFTGWMVLVFLTTCILLSFWTASIGHTSTTATMPIMEQPEE